MTQQIRSYSFCSQPVVGSAPWVGEERPYSSQGPHRPESDDESEELPPTQPNEEPWMAQLGSFGSQEGHLLPTSHSSEELSPTQPYDVPDSPPRASLSLDEEGEEYYLPVLRYPRVSSRCDTAYFDADLRPISVHGSQELFIEDQYILKRHVMRYVDCGPYPATRKVVAIAKNGKHIVWQQAIRSCVAAGISMIALDRGKVFLAKEITYAVANDDKQLRYIRDAGFKSVVYSLNGYGIEKAKKLEGIIAKSGPGLLHLHHPDLKSHMVVLDQISLAKDRVTLREPYHGYMISIRLFPFINWIGDEFIELT